MLIEAMTRITQRNPAAILHPHLKPCARVRILKLRQYSERNWQRWKAREAEERALAEMDDVQQLEDEQRGLFRQSFSDDMSLNSTKERCYARGAARAAREERKTHEEKAAVYSKPGMEGSFELAAR